LTKTWEANSESVLTWLATSLFADHNTCDLDLVGTRSG
jgi:hypothetical protein